MKLSVILFAIALPALAGDATVDRIMARVAENQARAQEARRGYVYNQKIQARFTRNNGKLAREEKLEYVVTPTPGGIEKKLAHFEGKYEQGGKFLPVNEPGEHHKDLDLDADLLESLVEKTADHQSKDGIASEQFPLTGEEQRKYDFTLESKEAYRGRPVYRVTFRPKPHVDSDGWKGEALIDAEECQPLMVHTTLAAHIPAAVKVLLGTDIRGLGFSVTYQKFDDGVWFPVSYGGEFHVRGVFFYSRNMSISMVNSGFTRANVTTQVHFEKSEE